VARARITRVGLYTAVVAFCFFFAAPFLWMIVTAFKTDRDLYRAQNNPFFFNEPPTLDNLEFLFFNTNYLVFIRNSLFVGAVVVIITLLLAVPAGYSLARLAGRWGERASIGMFLIYLVPPILLFIPLFRIVVALNLNNSLWSLVVTYPLGCSRVSSVRFRAISKKQPWWTATAASPHLFALCCPFPFRESSQ